MAGWSPLMRSITLTQNVKAQLSVKLTALDPNFPARLSYVLFNYDVTATGNLYIGNSGVTLSNCGLHLVPGSAQPLAPPDDVVLLTTDIYLLSDSATNQVNLTIVPKGM